MIGPEVEASAMHICAPGRRVTTVQLKVELG